MSIHEKEIFEKIMNTFNDPDTEVNITDLTGNNNHYKVEVVSKLFLNKSLLDQHKMVYDALGNIIGGALHALQLITKVK